MPTEIEIMEQLQKGKLLMPPLSLRLIQDQLIVNENRYFDAVVEISWMDNTARFIVELKSTSTPMVFQNALNFLKSSSLPRGYLPLLVMPFLSEQQLKELERHGISGIDLCGNCLLIAPGKYAVLRSGARNRFPSSALIKNIYRKNSSMVGRVFLTCSIYHKVQEICKEINQRNLLVRYGVTKPMSLSTVSKSLKTLENDLIIGRKADIRLLQADKLLMKLTENYFAPKTSKIIRLKTPQSRNTIMGLLLTQSQKLSLPITATGTSSTSQYTVMPRGDLLSVYCTDVNTLLKSIRGSQTDRFPNLELVETKDERVFFDARDNQSFRWASPIQVYLELMDGDKRDQETAEQIKSLILMNCRQEVQE